MTTSTAETRYKQWAWHLLALLFFAYLFSISTNFSLNDPDLWWHLKTGEYTAMTKTLPHSDPFNYTSPPQLNHNKLEGLRAHWLGQVIYYSAYKAAGLLGVGLFRGMLIVFPMLAIYLWLVERKAKPWIALCAISLGALILPTELFYAFERPQGISFLLSAFLVFLLEGLKEKRKISFYILPVMMAFWANVHAGFIVGVVIIAIYITGELLAFLYNAARKRRPAFNKIFFAGALLGIAATGLNPNKYDLLYNYLHGLLGMFITDLSHSLSIGGRQGWVANVVLEYKPLIYFYRVLFYKWLLFYWYFTALLLAALAVKYILRKKVDMSELLTVLFVGFFANYYARGLMFSIILFCLYFGKTLMELQQIEKKPKKIMGTLMLLVAILFMFMAFRNFAIYKMAASSVLAVSFGIFALGAVIFGINAFRARMVKDTAAFMAGVSLLLAVSFFNSTIVRPLGFALKPGITKQWVSPWYPSEGVQFLKQVRPAPPMYNFYTWGGFLIWSLYPDYKVFIDGRALSDNVSRMADAILKCYPGWQDMLNSFGINFIFIPVVFRESGHAIPLAISLAYDDNWKLIFIADNQAIFVKNAPENNQLIKKYGLDKQNIFREIVNTENILLYSQPDNPIFNINKADALAALGMNAQAQEIYSNFSAADREEYSIMDQMRHAGELK